MSPFEKFTPNAKQALSIAEEESRKHGLPYIGSEHLLVGLLSNPRSLAFSILTGAGVSLENVRMILNSAANQEPEAKNVQHGLSSYLTTIIEDAVRVAHKYNHPFIGTEHLLHALVSQGKCAATVILENMEIEPADFRLQIEEMFEQMANAKSKDSQQINTSLDKFLQGLQGVIFSPGQNDYSDAFEHKEGEMPTTPQQRGGANGVRKSKTPALDYFTTNLNEKYRKGEIDPIIGRNEEIERMIHILNRKTKNNPVLIGEPGVGKTAVVEGLAQAIVKEEIPDSLSGKKILSLSLSNVIAGTKYRGEFEERMKSIIEEATKVDNEIILFIDEIHTLTGTGSAEGSMDAANLLKPALSRGGLQIIGATTIDEYRKNIEKDKGLERRFQPVMVEEPSTEDCIKIIEGLRPAYEAFHNLVITDEAIEAAVHLSQRYITERYLPDKAIDLVDEAAALQGSRSQASTPEIQQKKDEIAKIEKKIEKEVLQQEYEKASALKQKKEGILKEIEEVKIAQQKKQKQIQIKEHDIGVIVGKITGVPVTKIMKDEGKKLANLEDVLHESIIAQDEAVSEISKSIRRSRVGIASANRPIGSFIFLGPTGVGKTELVKTLAREVYNNKEALIKIDMSEFMERHNVSRLVGSSAGYVGYEEGGQLTEAVRRKPYSVVLFDEIEKAHPEFFNILLQVLEDGYLTDAKGKKVDFRNTIIVMTSNLGAKQLTEEASKIGFDISTDKLKQAEEDFKDRKEQVLKELKNHFRPEFLNRIDKTIVFKPLTSENIEKVVELQLKELDKRLGEKGYSIEATPEAISLLAQLSYKPEYGARPVRRKIQDLIEDPIAERILDGSFKEGAQIIIDRTKGKEEFSFSVNSNKKSNIKLKVAPAKGTLRAKAA
ncbi:MAG: ATP-dependent Clp protease ATP-binding subunit [Candidatus Peregrinibacteria bacterium]|nr:ATP-dependent Clp protease ATP-binding subunit [Candidatus Peregrinibacteria bacterium]